MIFLFIRGALLRGDGFSKWGWFMVSANHYQVFILFLSVALREINLTQVVKMTVESTIKVCGLYEYMNT